MQTNGDGPRRIRISTSGSISTPRLKFKIGRGINAAGRPFYRSHGQLSDLDDSDEDYHHEEQIFLRLPDNEDAKIVAKMISERTSDPSVWLKFKDSRRAVFHVGEHLYSARLVDLPNIVESNKTLDRKQIFKVADISQMLIVEALLKDEQELLADAKPFNVDHFIWPHGMTPPMRHVRKRRFRKKLSKRAIETVEGEVERLLGEDGRADAVKYQVYDINDPNLSGSEFGSPRQDAKSLPKDDDVSVQDDATERDADEGSVRGLSEFGESRAGSDDEQGDEEEDFDADFAAELERDMGEGSEDGQQTDAESKSKRAASGSEVDVDSDDASRVGSDEDNEDEDNEEDDEILAAMRKTKLLQSEIGDLERKCKELESTTNQVISQRLTTVLLPMLQTKRDQLAAAKDDLEVLRHNKADSEGEGEAERDGEVEAETAPADEMEQSSDAEPGSEDAESVS